MIDYYSEFEEEPGIKFLYTGLDGIEYSINMWIGYFDNIMGVVEPTSEGWNGLSYYYHTHTGWYNYSSWQVSDSLVVLHELQTIDHSQPRGSDFFGQTLTYISSIRGIYWKPYSFR